jgi:hypothetical protein
MMAHDLFFYNGTDYTADAYVNDVTSRYGGIDSVLIWYLPTRCALVVFEGSPLKGRHIRILALMRAINST